MPPNENFPVLWGFACTIPLPSLGGPSFLTRRVPLDAAFRRRTTPGDRRHCAGLSLRTTVRAKHSGEVQADGSAEGVRHGNRLTKL